MSKIKGTMHNNRVLNKPSVHLPKSMPHEKGKKYRIYTDVVLPFCLSLFIVVLLAVIFKLTPGINLFKSKGTGSPEAVKSKPVYKPAVSLNQKTMVDFLRYESYLYVDPVSLIDRMKQEGSSFTLVDLRSPALFAKSHIKGAVNIPYDKKQLAVQGQTDLFTQKFSAFADREIILYGENRYSSLPRDAAVILAEKGIYPRLLSAGWTDFRNFINDWLPENRWNGFDINQYIVTVTGE